MFTTKAEQNNIKATIAASYDKLYSQFSSDELSEVGNYKIGKFIGEGSFGKVYLATHKLTHQKVVLKTGNKRDPNVVREVFYHRQFDFANITKLYEVIVTESKVWMALEYCSGHELYDHLLNEHRLSLEEAKKLFAQIASAVFYAHELKCVHRDLKLENVLLDGNGHAKLTDFGFTREMATRSQLETICGTTVYMAPELIERKNYDGFKVDIWSLGVMLYTMVNGYMPFDEDDENSTELKIIGDEPRYDQEWISEDAVDLIKGMLRKIPEERLSLNRILLHPFLQPWGESALEKTNKVLLKQRGGNLHFHSKHEKRLLKRLKQCGFDTSAIKNSINKRKCDSLSGLWFLLQQDEAFLEAGAPKRTRSVLSVRKVFESSVNMVMDDILVQSPECVKTNSSKRIISGKSSEPQQQKLDHQISTGVRNPSRDNSPIMPSFSAKEQVSGKKGFFKRVSALFKTKKHNSVMLEPHNVSKSSPQVLEQQLGKRKHKPRSNDSEVPTLASSSKGTTTSERNVQFDDDDRNNYKPKVKRMKSHSSRIASRAGQDSLQHTESTIENTDGISKESRITPTRRSSVASRHSAVSNDTMNSDYSTDMQSGFRSVTTQSSSRLNINLETAAAIRKNVRRTLSVLSSASSNSEMSSRTDSFYDITTASSPMNMDMRSNYNIRSDSHFPQVSVASPWLNRANTPLGRHTRIGNRTLNRKFRHSTGGHQQSAIQEESSFDEKDRSMLPPMEEYDAAEIAVQSESETPSKDNTPQYVLGIDDAGTRPVLLSTRRSFSEGSTWSHPQSDLVNVSSAPVMSVRSISGAMEDKYDAEIAAADDEDNSAEDDEQEHLSFMAKTA